ncbi:hypothetical protein H2200_003819 [Cladophialophora chaetospira]|uniref:Glutamyl-tRNA synthetase n=1 Tax=Cladophialophora chaetospira TaxID=386627 RepID=A0AA38XF42_9EURO|nr:hypothetical protein H2200_003819 [Cladophialophora chaetospira]
MAPDLDKALTLIDTAHKEDPNKVEVNGGTIPYEFHYAEMMIKYLTLHTPDANPLLVTAARAQHFRRWEVPRDSYPRTKAGYFAWRTFLKKRQAEQVKEICLHCSYSEDEASKVAALIAKEELKKGEGKGDADAQVIEDVACLVFLDDQFDQFEKGHDEEKIVSILQKTWVKMGKRGQELALKMDLSERAKELSPTFEPSPLHISSPTPVQPDLASQTSSNGKVQSRAERSVTMDKDHNLTAWWTSDDAQPNES